MTPQPQNKATRAKRATLEILADIGKRAVAYSASLVALVSAVWFFAENEVRQGAQDFTGITELIQRTDTVAGQVSELREGQMALKVQVAALVPTPSVAEYDPLRSLLEAPCFVGEACLGKFRARRTDFGGGCGAPEVIGRWFVDSRGERFSVERHQPAVPTMIRSDWILLPVGFIVPEQADSGVGEFSLDLRYHCLVDNDNNPATAMVKVPFDETTPRLTVEIRNHETP